MAERIAAIAARAEAKAAARAKEKAKKIGHISTGTVTSSSPKVLFVSKKERERRKLEREKRAVEEAKRRRADLETRHKIFVETSQRRSRDHRRSPNNRNREDQKKRKRATTSRSSAQEAEIEAIREQYMGIKSRKKEKKKKKKSRGKNFVFDWDASDDTTDKLNPLYDTHGGPHLAFGRGFVAGVDLREQRKNSKYLEALIEDRQKRQREMEESMSLSREERERNDLARKREREAVKRDAERAKEQVKKQLSVFDATVQWRKKKLDQMTARDWRILREDFNIRVRGGRAPHPLRYWSESNICPALLKAIDEMNFKDPSPIQRQAIPVGMSFKDVIGIAETGSGKTAAFVIPMIHYIQQLPKFMRDRTPQDGPLALIMAPTRELAQQIEREAERLAKYCEMKIVSIVGGQNIEAQGFKVRQGCDIIIATPGRMLDCMENRYVVLNQCNYIVLDEADRMIDLGFESQLNGILESMATLLKAEKEEELEQQIASKTNGSVVVNYRVTSMYSATMPTEVEDIAKKFLRHPVIVTIGDKDSRVNMRITQNVIFMTEAKKKKKLVEILRRNEGPFIIFVNIRATCDVVRRVLRESHYRCGVLHGGIRQDAREAALQDFRDKRFPILVATDVAGRGIDIPGVKHVVNFDMSSTIERYCHRIGRTGRAGKTGIATTFLTEKDESVMYDLKQYLTKTKQDIPRELEKNPAANKFPGAAEGGSKTR